MRGVEQIRTDYLDDNDILGLLRFWNNYYSRIGGMATDRTRDNLGSIIHRIAVKRVGYRTDMSGLQTAMVHRIEKKEKERGWLIG
jgi:hypothetical protein